MMTRPMTRILMTGDSFGGVWTYALELTKALEIYGVHVLYASMGKPLRAGQLRMAEKIPNLQVVEAPYRLEWMEDPWKDLIEAGDWLLKLEEKFRPDIVHLNSYTHGALPWKAPKLVVGHSCVLSWWEAVKKDPLPSSWRIYAASVRQGLAKADWIVAPSQFMLDALLRHYGPFFSPTSVIPNGRTYDSTAPLQTISKEEFIFCAGRIWDDAKNIQSLIEAAPHLPWPIVVAGDANHPNGDKADFSNVRLVGEKEQDELQELYQRASIYVLPALYEPFGLSALEAALAGCPLVLGDIPSLREVWEENALFINTGDSKDLVETLLKLIGDELQRLSWGLRSRSHALRYGAEQMADGYVEIYNQLKRTRNPESQSISMERTEACDLPSSITP